MLSLLISVIFGFTATLVSRTWIDSTGWSVFVGSLIFIITSIVLNRYWGKKLTSQVNDVQEILQESQQDAFKMINRFQTRPSGSQKMMETKVEKVVEKGVLKALDLLDTLQPIYKWSIPRRTADQHAKNAVVFFRSNGSKKSIA